MGAPGGSGGLSNLQSAISSLLEGAQIQAADKAFIQADRAADAQAALAYAPMPAAFATKTKKMSLKERSKQKVKETKEKTEMGDKLEKIKALKQSAKEFEQKYGRHFPDQKLKAKTLLQLKESIKPSDDPQTILKKVAAEFTDVSAQDIALQYLEENTEAGDLLEAIKKARSQLKDKFGREIKAGRNVAERTVEFSKSIGEKEGPLREFYRDYSKRGPKAEEAWKELRTRYKTHNERVKMIKFLEKALSDDIKSEGPSMEPAKLTDLLSQIKGLQAIAHVDKEFWKQLQLILKKFSGDIG